MTAARTRDGFGPMKAVKAQARSIAAARAPRRPRRGAARKETRAARMPRCWPERARIWEQPAFRKASARSRSRSSRTPRTRASRRAAPSPPARARADLRSDRSRALNSARPVRKPRASTSLPRAKRTQPAPPRSWTGRPRIRIRAPVGIAAPARSTMTGSLPFAETRMPGPAPAASRSRTSRRPPDRRGAESSAAVPWTHSTDPAGSPKAAGDPASRAPRRARKARARAAAAARRRRGRLRIPRLQGSVRPGPGSRPASRNVFGSEARAKAQRARAATGRTAGARPGGAK